MPDSIVIVGCGITGLWTGLALVLKGVSGSEITYYAEHMPGDISPYYASPIAGANFSLVSGDDDKALRHDKISYQSMDKLIQRFGAENIGIEMRPAIDYYEGDVPSKKKLDSVRTYAKDFDWDPEAKCLKFTTYNFNTPKVCKFIQDFLTGQGVSFVRRKIGHIREAYGPKTTAVFNCTALGARSLGGVEDKKMYPVRGQVLVVKDPSVNFNYVKSRTSNVTYVIPRPYSDSTVIIGGYQQPHVEVPDTYGYESYSLWERAKDELPFKGKPKPQVLRDAAGLRPYREGGVRIEKEEFEGKTLIHLLGAGGYGYQSGYAMALDAIALLKEYKTKSLL